MPPPDIEAAIRWTPQERESFFAAIARHRAAARRTDLGTRACALALAIAVAILMAPLYYAIIGVVLDLANLIIPMPDLLGTVMDNLSEASDTPEKISVARWIYLLAMAAIPGVIVMALAIHALDRVMREAMTSDAANFAGRAPNTAVLAEQRFANVVAEMAVAANLAPPRVLIVDAEQASAAAFGENDRHATLVISTGLLHLLDRAQLQGVAAHLVGSIANGDMLLGVHVATTLGLFGLIGRLSDSFSDREAFKRFLKVLRASLRRGSSVEDGQLALMLTNPFESDDESKKARPAHHVETTAEKIRLMLSMPLAGPLVFSGFFGNMLSTMALGPLLAMMWRRRKHLADATAVQLTRDPDALAGALQKLRGMHVEGAFAPWVAHMTIVDSGLIGGRNIMSGSPGRMFPSLDKRLKALVTMGSTVAVYRERRVEWGKWWILVPVLGALAAVLAIAVLPLLVFVSMALSGLFTFLPAMILHAILR